MSDPINDLITEIIEDEGGATVTNDPNDGGGRTQYGISEKSNPEAWADGKVTEEEARAIYFKKYVVSPHFDKITHRVLQHQLVDFGVLSGPGVATQHLQRALGVEDDGILGPQTLAALAAADSKIINNRVMTSRVRMLGRIVNRRRSQAEYIQGWLDRSCSFLVE